jgi:uncharacterized membrane protein
MHRSLLATLAATALGAAGPALAQGYTFQTVKVSGALTSNPTGFGPTGAIGYDVSLTAKTKGFIQNGKSFKAVTVKGAASTQLFGYANGLYVGYDSKTASSNPVGFMMTSSGQTSTIAFPASALTEALGINAAHTVVGTYGATDGSGDFLAFAYANGAFTSFQVPNAEYTEATGINTAGTIVGWSEGFTTSPVGFMLQNGVFTTISVPGSIETFVQGINDNNQIVGYYTDNAQNGFTGFVFDGTTYKTLNDPAGTSTYAYGINNAGQVAGFAVTRTGDVGYIATPASLVR